MRRTAAKGCHSLSFTENPAALGYPSFHDEYWDPVWQACCDTGTVLSIHLGSSGRLSIPAVDSPPDVMITLQPMNIQSAAADLLWSRVLKNFPDLRIALSEGGTGWIPYFLDRVDRTYEMHRAWTQQDFGGRLPSEVFREHFLTCFISDPIGVELRDRIGVDNICLGGRLPPQRLDVARPPPRSSTRCSPATTCPTTRSSKITHENAMRWYSFDPFTHIARDDATVGALRRPGGRPRRVDHVPQHPGPHPRREARGLPGPGPTGRRRRELTGGGARGGARGGGGGGEGGGGRASGVGRP